MNVLSMISREIESILGKNIKNKLKCYYRSFKYPNIKLRYKNNLCYYYFPDSIVVKSVNFFDENPLILNNGYLKYYSPKKGDIVIDAGAFLGAFSIYFAKKYPDAKIIAFEPSEVNYKQLQENLELNNVEDRIKIIKKGLWDSKSKLSIAKGGGADAMVSTNLSKNRNQKEIISTIDLDSEIKVLGIKKIGFIKMDIEGAEIEALQGMKKTLKSKPSLAIASYHVRNGKKTYKRIMTFLKIFYSDVKTGYPRHLTTWANK